MHSLTETDKFNTLGIPVNIDETSVIISNWITENEKEEFANYSFAIEHNLTNQLIVWVKAME